MRRLDRNVVAASLASAVLLGLAALWVGWEITGPSDGARIEYIGPRSAWSTEGVRIVPLRIAGQPLQAGDLLLSIDGTPLAYWVQRLFSFTPPRPAWTKGQVMQYIVRRDGQLLKILVRLGNYPLAELLHLQWINFLSFFLMLAIGGYVFYRRPRLPAARLLYLAMAALASSLTLWAVSDQVYDLINPWHYWVYHSAFLIGFLGFSLLLHLALIFPSPQKWTFSSRRLLFGLIYLGPPCAFLGLVLAACRMNANSLTWLRQVPVIGDRIELALLFVLILAYLASYWNVRSDPVSREQARWFLGGLTAVTVLAVALNGLPKLFLGSPLLRREMTGLLLLPLPLGTAVAILRYHLFDIEVLINRTLVYATLTALVIGGYVAAVGGLGGLLGLSGNLWVSLAFTGLVAVVFQPLRERVQRAVNRLMYGERDDPYAVFSRLGQRLKATMTPEATLPTVVATIAEALKLPYVAIRLQQGDGLKLASEVGQLQSSSQAGKGMEVFPLIYQNEMIGELIVARRSPGESLTRADKRLLNSIADQAGSAAYTVRLMTDLQASRERLVTAREEERRRLRRDLHDGLGSALASLSFNLDAAKNLLARDPAATEELLAELKSQTQAAISDIRRLINDLRPPALDELGLLPALQQTVDHINRPAGLVISIQAPAGMPSLPAAVEVAAYRIVIEALTNVIRHAGAKTCAIHLSLPEPDCLAIEVVDDGQGLTQPEQPGIGLSTMRERAAELGGSFRVEANPSGGTRVLVTLPFSRFAPNP